MHRQPKASNILKKGLLKGKQNNRWRQELELVLNEMIASLRTKNHIVIFCTGWGWIWGDHSSKFPKVKFPGKVRRNLLKLRSAQNSEIVHLIKDMTYKMEIAVNFHEIELWSQNVSSWPGFARSLSMGNLLLTTYTKYLTCLTRKYYLTWYISTM